MTVGALLQWWCLATGAAAVLLLLVVTVQAVGDRLHGTGPRCSGPTLGVHAGARRRPSA